MLFFKRIPGLFYAHQNLIYSVILLLLSTLYILFRWNIICLNFQSRRYIRHACKKYELGQAVGTLCSPLCVTQSITSLNCYPMQSRHKKVFIAEFHETNIIFKTALTAAQSVHWFENNVIKYPSEEEFLAIVRNIVRKKLNITITAKLASTIAHLTSEGEKNPISRHTEMDNLWSLLQDNEYLLSSLFAEKDLFPLLLGTCGSYFAVEYIEPLESFTNLLSESCSQEEWARRLRTAALLIELLEDLAKDFNDIFYLCDIRISHFGLTISKTKVKFTSLSGVSTKAIIFSHLDEIKCLKDSECSFYDCRSRCLKNNKCSHNIINNNMQILCEKIFVGWRMSNTILIPGLLMTPQIPAELASLLRQCAHSNLEFANGMPYISEEDMRKGLYNILIEIEQSVNGEA